MPDTQQPEPTIEPQGILSENIETVLRTEEEMLARKTNRVDRLTDAIAGFFGTLPFVAAQVIAMAGWIAVNVGAVPAVAAFDPYPFSLLSAVVSAEGVFLTAFVLIRQNRMSAVNDRRDHIDLQINLLTEREVTRLLQMTERIARHLNVDAEAGPLGQITAIDTLLGHLDEKLSDPSPT